MQNLDEYDLKLLRLLQQNNQLPAKELGDAVNLSASAVQRRLVRLREERIIEADVSIISPAAMGITVTCIVNVILHDGHSTEIDKFRKMMLECEEVTQCYFVTGSYDFVVIVQARDMSHYEEFSKRTLMDNKNVKHFYTHVVLDKVKRVTPKVK